MTTTAKNYSEQDRGDSDKYKKYLSGMDSVIVEKIASASAFFPHIEGHAIVDIGMASGTGTYILALLFPKCKVIGVDVNLKMVEIARETYQLPNLEFIVDDGEKLEKLENEKIIGFFNCSSIHHITSFNDYAPHKAYLTIKRQTELLREGGVLVIRDFVKPEDKDVLLEFPDNDEGAKTCELLVDFSKRARSLSNKAEQGFPLEKVDKNTFRIDLVDAVEFIRRKDYLDDWDIELQEEYGYYTQSEFEQVFTEMGLRTIASGPVYNPWILKNRYKNKFKLTDLQGKDIGFPATNYIIAGEKVENRGTMLRAIRSLPISQESFIKLNSYKNKKTDFIYDVAQRPYPVIDILPYFIGSDGNIKIIAKHGYPRPIVNQIKKADAIDKKRYSGYITESITAMKGSLSGMELIKETLLERASISDKLIGDTNKSVTFYPSPGGIDELVDSYQVELKTDDLVIKENQVKNFSGFNELTHIRKYDAIQLLKSIQVGAVPDIRLEINLYNLFQKQQIDFGNWLNDKIQVEEIKDLKISKYESLLSDKDGNEFESCTQSAGFLKQYRTKFYEYNREDSTSILEYISPDKTSLNTVVVLPVFKYNGEVYVGLETRFLPVPQIQEGNSKIITAPAFRVPQGINTKTALEKYLDDLSVNGSPMRSYTKLGEKYLPCTGLTPEQVYPYVVTLESATDDLSWVSLTELLSQTDILRDGHLLVCLYRLMHALRG